MYEAVQHTHKTSHKHLNHSLVQHLHNQQCALLLVMLVFGEVLFLMEVHASLHDGLLHFLENSIIIQKIRNLPSLLDFRWYPMTMKIETSFCNIELSSYISGMLKH